MIVVVACSLALSWLVMQAVHEFGHVINALLSGGSVVRVLLAPLELSHTELRANPHPQFVAWGGPLWGSAGPAILLLINGSATLRQLGWFFAGFCLTANGAYLFAGVVTGSGDPADLVRLGAWSPVVALIGVALATAGLWVWHRLGAAVGFRVHQTTACRTATLLACLLALVVGAELLMLPR